MGRIAKADNRLSPIVERKLDIINLSLEKLLSQLAIQTLMVRSSLRHKHKCGVESSKRQFVNHCKTSIAVALRSKVVPLLRTSRLNLSISTINSEKSTSSSYMLLRAFKQVSWFCFAEARVG